MLSKVLARLKRSQPAAAEIASARRQAPLNMAGLAPNTPDDLVARHGLEIYDRMQADAQIAACLATKKFAVLARGWQVIEASGSPENLEAAEFCRFALQDMQGTVEDTLFGILDALAKGYSIAELNFRRIEGGTWDGRIGIASIKHKDPALFEFETDEFLNVTGLIRTGADGAPERRLPVEKFVIYTYMPSYQEPRGRSDLRACYKHWWAKDIILRFLSSHLERFGSPVVKGTYRRGMTIAQQDDLLRALEGIQREAAIVVPEDVTVELLQAAAQGEQGFMEAIAYHDRQIAKAILGETLTQEEGHRTGALALAKVHQDTMLLRLQKIKRDLEETVVREQVFRPLVALNFPGASAPRFSLGSLEDRDLDRLSVVLERLIDAGAVAPGEAWVREWLGLPEDGRAVKRGG